MQQRNSVNLLLLRVMCNGLQNVTIDKAAVSDAEKGRSHYYFSDAVNFSSSRSDTRCIMTLSRFYIKAPRLGN